MSDLESLLPGSREVPFGQLESTLAGSERESRRTSTPRTSTATVVAVGTPAQLAPAVDAITTLCNTGSVRTILIAEGTDASPAVRVSGSLIAIDGLAPRYLNNAVAALRLPSLPALIWWRGGPVEALMEVTRLADRLVLDTDDPEALWKHAEPLLKQTALTDIRWTRLTRWRAVLAHLFDLPQLIPALGSFGGVVIEANDRPCARLFAAWLVSVGVSSAAHVQIESAGGDPGSPLEAVRLPGERVSITIRRVNGGCLEASIDGEVDDVRVAPLGDDSLSACITAELAVRTRDIAFERALAAAIALPADTK
jgi:hypothetical protein